MDIKLWETVRSGVLANLPYDQRSAALSTELRAKEAGQLLIIYWNWKSRHPRPVPRRVVKSKAFEANPIAKQRAAELAIIIGDIEKGRDLTRYLSRDIGYVVGLGKARKKSRRDLDLMLSDWGVHHLHISTQMDADGFVNRDRKRGGLLLFAVFRPDTAYLIDAMKHGDWTRKHVIRVIADEWPDAGIVRELKGIRGQAGSSEEEHQKLRADGIAVPVEIDGRVLKPNITTARTSDRASFAAKQVLKELDKFEARILANPDWLKAQFARHGVTYPDEPQFEFAFFKGGYSYGVMETVTGTPIGLAELIP